jgi:hypothetical protein
MRALVVVMLFRKTQAIKNNTRELYVAVRKDVIYIDGSPVHVAPACVGAGEGSDHFGSYVCNLSLHFCKRLFFFANQEAVFQLTLTILF